MVEAPPEEAAEPPAAPVVEEGKIEKKGYSDLIHLLILLEIDSSGAIYTSALPSDLRLWSRYVLRLG